MAALLVAALIVRALKHTAPYPRPLHRPAATACSPHWVGTWAASPSGTGLSQSLSDQTVRMIVDPHLGGSTLRVDLSNRYGEQSVLLGPVTVGVRGDGAALQPGTERPVTFAGRPTISLAPGAGAVSDPVKLAVRPFTELAVSVYVPGTAAHPDEHLVTRQTSYLSPRGGGDDGAQTSAADFTQTTAGDFSSGWYYLDGIDVQAPGSTGAVVAFGDSLTDGYQPRNRAGSEDMATVDANGRYPDDLTRRLLAAGIPLSVLNAGISGNLLLQSGLPFFGQSGLERFGPDVLDQAGVSDVIVLLGINDIGHGATAVQVIGGLEQLIDRAHAAGVAIQLGTLLPTHGAAQAAYASAAATSARTQVNDWIRSQRFSDGIVDFDAAVRDPSDPEALAPAYAAADDLHLTPAGNEALARAVNLTALARPNCR